MTPGDDREPDRILSSATIDFAIRLGFIALLGYWSFRVIAPFLTIGLWSAILVVALYPVFDWLTRWLSPRAAAARSSGAPARSATALMVGAPPRGAD